MKHFSYTVAALLTFAAATRAMPVQPGLVPQDAKWMVHLDVDNLRESKVGNVLIKDVLAKPLAKLKSEMKVDGQLILKKLHSLTAFGNDFQAGPQANGVLLLSGDSELQKIVEGFFAAQMLQNAEGPFKKLQDGPSALYSVNDEIFVTMQSTGQVVLGKSRKEVEKVSSMLAGTPKAAGASNPFTGYANLTNTFFFLAVAEGFNQKTALPPNAEILKKATGARIVLGEKADQLFANLALKAKDAEVIQQIQQVLEGMKALVSLSQSENKELMDLVQSTKVSTGDKVVTVNLEYPISKVMDKLDMLSEHLEEAMGDHGHANPPKAETKQPAKPDAEPPAKSDAPAKK